MSEDIIWRPSSARIETANLTRFAEFLAERAGIPFPDYWALHRFSIENPETFWPKLAEFTGALGEFGKPVLSGERMFDMKWFPDARLNYAKTMLKRRDEDDAIVFLSENGSRRSLSANALYDHVSQLAAFLKSEGVTEGDRVAGFVANTPEAIIAMLASASIGAIWSSCSPDFGRQGILDRFGQIEPKILFAVDGYYYNGKTHDCGAKIIDVLGELPSVEKLVVLDYIGSDALLKAQGAIALSEIYDKFPPQEIAFASLPFDHPLFILYSSGTTGAPKCIVHGHGGTLLQHLKEHQLHSDIKPGDRVFYFTTCSWMMWNWLVSALGSGAAIMLFDGSPFYPSPDALWDYAENEGFSFFGTGAKYIEALQKAGTSPKKERALAPLRTIASTGSPLAPEGYDYIYEHVKADLHLASISGGTDIVSCFVLGVPLLPVRRGEIQAPGLGMAVEVWDGDGNPVRGEQGELVCTRPFPSRPVSFWRDEGGKKYHSAYYERFENIWTHGDFAEITGAGGVIIYGRSDATLNPGGVRIGTAEIYRQVDKVDEVLESIVIGQEWEGDVRVVLFVKLREGVELDEALIKRVKSTIRENCTPRHVPAKVLTVGDIPRTKSGKIVEIPVRDVVHGREVKNKEALANPEALEHFQNRAELSS